MSLNLSWLFGKKDKEKKLDDVMREQLTQFKGDFKAEFDEFRQQLTKMTRLQYKSRQETQSALEQLSEELRSLEQKTIENQVKSETLSDLLRQRKHLVGAIISQLDDVDVVCAGMQEGTDDEWLPLLQQWSEKIITTLSELDIKEIDVVGKTFEPQSADSMGTISRILSKQIDIPYEVASVVKRGFIDRDGVLLRKAQVITYKEDQI